MKKLLVLVLLCVLIMATIPVFATGGSMNQIKTEEYDTIVVPLTGGLIRASWGEGILKSKNPLGRKPYATAITKTYAGTAYKLKAKVSVDNSDDTTNASDWAVATNKESVESATIIAKTESCTFNGYHKAQDTSSSGWQSCSTSKSY